MTKSTVAERLFAALNNAPGKTLPIDDLYVYTFEREDVHLDQRRKQQALGKPISKLNKQLRKRRQRIKPGEARGTYALVDTGSGSA